MFAFLKKLIAGKQVETKFNAVESMMDIDGEQVSVKNLIDGHKQSLAEAEEKKKLEAAQFEEVSMDNEVADSEGNKYKIGDMIESHRNRTAAKKNVSEDEEKAAKEKEAKEKENSTKCNCEAKEGKHNSECPAKEKEGKENAEESDEELKIKKQNEKDEAEKKEKEEAEKKAKENAKGDKLRFFKKLNTLRDEAEGKKEVAVRSIGTMSDRLARGKAKFGAKKPAVKK